jgi:putative glutamine amidotransferase
MTSHRPLIALTPLMDYGRDSLWMLPGYMEAIIRAGGTPIMLPLTDDPAIIRQCADRFDAFLFTGGPDVGPGVGPHAGSRVGLPANPHADLQSDSRSPASHGTDSPVGHVDDAVVADGVSADVASADEAGGTDIADVAAADEADGTVAGRAEALSPERDRMESLLLPAVMELDKPILGICRGIQFINASLGGTLWQDLPSEHPSNIEHHMNPPYDAFSHDVTLVPHAPLAELFPGVRTIPVNSYHHQAVREPAEGFKIMALAPDGIIEAMYRPASHFVWAVQWHPEFLYKVDPRSQAIFDIFVAHCL